MSAPISWYRPWTISNIWHPVTSCDQFQTWGSPKGGLKPPEAAVRQHITSAGQFSPRKAWHLRQTQPTSPWPRRLDNVGPQLVRKMRTNQSGLLIGTNGDKKWLRMVGNGWAWLIGTQCLAIILWLVYIKSTHVSWLGMVNKWLTGTDQTV